MEKEVLTECYDIAIVGAGLVGNSAALAVAQVAPHLNIVLLDAGAEPVPIQDHTEASSVADFDPRVVALTRDSQKLLQAVGAWDIVAATRLCPYTDMQVWDAYGTGRITFDCSEIQEANLGHIVENKLLVSALTEQVLKCKNITTRYGCTVSSLERLNSENVMTVQGMAAQDNAEQDNATQDTAVEDIAAVDQDHQLHAKLVLACDGANSPLRKMVNLNTREWDYGHDAIVTTVQTSKAHLAMARQRFISSGPLAYLPLARTHDCNSAEENFCSIVWSCVPERAEELMALDDKAFAKELAAALEFELGEVEAVAKRFRIPLRQRHAREYIKPGIALAGDAAHTIHPLAGQGVNLGLKDVAAFSEQIQYALDRDIAIDHYSILRRYQRQRMSDNLSMMATMESFKRLFASGDIAVRWLRNVGMRNLDRVTVLKNKVVRQAMGL